MVFQGLNGLLVDEGAEVDVVPAVRVAADESLFRKRGDFHRPVGGEPVHIGDLRVALDQDVQDRGIDKPVLLLCQKRQRPAFFRGVATVVTKLLAAARPHLAVFGEKDFQQLQVVRRLARDLLLDVEIVGAPIVREADGLAMSSRNVYLDAAMRAEALALVRALDAAEAATLAGERSAAVLLEQVRKEIGRAPHAKIDYAELRDPETLAERALIEGPALLAVAVRFPAPRAASGEVRLIDNRVLLRRRDAEDPPR